MENKTGRGFKRKTIVQVIKKKIDKWLASISDENLRARVKNDYIVTGGAIASMLLGELPNDFDIYFQTTAVADSLANYYVSRIKSSERTKIKVIFSENRVIVNIKSAGVVRSEDDNQSDYEYFEGTDGSNIESYLDKESFKKKEPFTLAMITSNAISLHGDIQLIMRFIGDPAEIHKNYDYQHCTNYYTERSGLVLNQGALECVLSKELRYVGSLYPICSIFRIKKFLARGWTITAGEMLKICWDISKLNLDDMNVLYDQLVGVDAAYFNELIGILKNKSDRSFDRAYLFELINRVFDEDTTEVEGLIKEENT